MAENNGSWAARPHILVVDDDDRIRALVCRYLNDHGFLALSAANSAEAHETLSQTVFDALVVDVMMPGQDGRALTAEIRQTQDIPILLLTALSEVEDKIKGLTAGADDYLPKPFDPRELVLRLQAILRRRPKFKPGGEHFKIGDWIFNPAENDLVDGAVSVRLTDVELTLLRALCGHPNDILSREVLAEKCGLDASERTIDVQVARLRRKLGEDSKTPKYLQTVRGKGYMLRAERIEAP
ncbi:MAG: response regulator transcription factor [Alphaproteobacteria bacterium]|nr:response regulator transcription factor [Alphaproteobacteria bacterium]